MKLDGRFFDTKLEVLTPLRFRVSPEVEQDDHLPGVPCQCASEEAHSLPVFCCCGHAGTARGFLRLASSAVVMAPPGAGAVGGARAAGPEWRREPVQSTPGP